LITRGFVPFSLTQSDAPASNVAPPTEPVHVVVRLRAAQEGADRAAPSGQVYAIDPTSFPAELPQPVYVAYGDLVQQTPAPSDDLELPPPADIGLGPHLFYAIQWWCFIGIALIGYVVLIRREAALAQEPADPGNTASSGPDDTPAKAGSH
jgi:cytochrome oxidase assembly protein ShyY1